MGPRFWQGRWPVAWAIAAVSIIFAIGWFTTGSSYLAWRFLGVRSPFPAFSDLRAVGGWIDCAQKGIDPYINATCDPMGWGRLDNLPSIWLHLGAFGISSASTNALGCLLIVLLCASLLLIYDTRTGLSGALAFAAVVSPPVLLLAERGNVDILMFASLVATAYVMAKRTDLGAMLVQCAVIAFLMILKIYPIAGAVVLVQRKYGRIAIVLMGVLAMIGLLGVIGLRELKAIALHTPQIVDLTYGDMPIFIAANDHGLLLTTFDTSELRFIATLIALILAGIASTVTLLWPSMLRGFLPALNLAQPIGAVTVSCVSVFCFSFLLGANFDYRLIFLVGVLPALLNAYDVGQPAGGLLAAGAVVLFLWASRISSHILVPFEVLDWSLFVVGVMWLTQTAFEDPHVKIGDERELHGRPGVEAVAEMN